MKDKMTPTPWEIDEVEDELHIVRVGGFPESVCALYSEPMDDETKANAFAIVSAVNATYGAGINPEAVPDLLESLKETLAQFKKIDKHYSKDHEIMARAEAAIEKAQIK